MSDVVEILKFAPLQSFIQDTFWHKFAEIKLKEDRLSDAPKSIFGYYSNLNAKSCLLEVDYSAFNSEFKAPNFCHVAKGTLYNKNTIEEFKTCDKNALLTSEGRKLLEDIKSNVTLDDPSCLARFLVLSFADLKCHSFYYWFAFPCPLTTSLNVIGVTEKLCDTEKYESIECTLNRVPNEKCNFFVLHVNDSCKYYTLKEFIDGTATKAINAIDEFYFCFADNSEFEHPSWVMRIFMVFLFYKCPSLIGKPIKVLGLRCDGQRKIGSSLIWTVCQNEVYNIDDVEAIKFVGWEPNQNNKMAPRYVSMEESMDPEKLAESSINLNLQLMKWRLLPYLNLDIMAKTKCLLFGAGTLGCAVARNLLSWGFKYVTLVDSGRVGFSNPVRQCLYTHADAVAGNKMKAPTAAEHLKEINPNVVATGYVIEIPMPGHTVGASMQQQTEEALNTIKSLVDSHDVIFLLTDSRESRWLPTLLGAAANKIVINAALGFDSYVVMRHGSTKSNPLAEKAVEERDIDDLKCISGLNLGCYFCNDVTAPGNSLSERTLDQQCTVTRPGVSNIAASYAVELLVSLLQHPQREFAPAYYSVNGQSSAQTPEGMLGIIPHSIRGMLFNYENILPATRKFNQCIGCSEFVLNEYKAQGNAFLFKAFETAKYLEDLTGISDYKNLRNEIIDFNDSDLEMSDA